MTRDGASGFSGVVNRKWLVKPRPVANPRLRVVCVPHAGAGASVFNQWPDSLPPTVELCVVRLPGRENRVDEPLITDMRVLLDRLAVITAPLMDRPFVLFGHCSGSLLAFAFARWLQTQSRQQPSMLVVSSIGVGMTAVGNLPLHVLPQQELLARVADFGGIPTEVVHDPEMMAIFEPILRADTRLLETATFTGPRLDVPIVAVGGLHDDTVRYESLAAWRWETTSCFSLHIVNAGHFVLNESAALVGSLLRDLCDSLP
jgi:medium-chain acyl-[acyl-carrier-protein] hydrolase